MRRVAIGVTAALLFISPPLDATAIEETTATTNNGNVTVTASSTVVVNEGSPSGPVCVWQRLTRGDLARIGGGSGAGGVELTPEESAEIAINEVAGTLYEVYSVACPGLGTRLRLVDPNVTAADLIDTITAAVTSALPEPQHAINPSPDVGSFVNLGLWLAVEEQVIAPITAEAGPAWITARPVLTNVTFDMGTGDDPISCNGLGTAYTDGSNEQEQGPCGYTYLQSSPDDAPYTILVTTQWTIPYTSSNGPGELNPIPRSTPIDYDVDEVQTIGTD